MPPDTEKDGSLVTTALLCILIFLILLEGQNDLCSSGFPINIDFIGNILRAVARRAVACSLKIFQIALFHLAALYDRNNLCILVSILNRLNIAKEVLMSVMELLASRRTYRRFEQKAVPQDVVEDIIEALRLSSCGANRQAVRLVVVNRPEDVARVQPLVKWAAYLPPEQGTPKADELPTLYVAVMQDTSIPGDLATDTGIALANMTLAAWAKGVGSCIMGAINKPALTRLLGIEEPQKLAFMVAFGYPAHKAGIVPLTEQTGVKYYLDENRDYCVPKRSREEIARYL